jgi:ATP-dependent protease Clp ATPase subunit
MLDTMYEIPGRGGVKEVVVGEETILRGEKPLMVLEKEAGQSA